MFYVIDDEWPVGSSVAYRTGLASSLARGDGFSYAGYPNLYQTPVYPAFLAVVFYLVGNHWWTIAVSQSLVDSLTAILVGKIGSRLTPHGWLAGIFYAVFPYAAMQCRAIVDTPIVVLLFVAASWAFLAFLQSHRKPHLFVGIIAVGVGILARPTCIVIVGAFCVAVLFSRIRVRRAILISATTLGLAAVIPLAWTYRNYELTGDFPVLAVGGQHALWYSHNEHVGGIYERGESPDRVGRDPRYPMYPNYAVSSFFGVEPKEQLALANECSNKARIWVSDHPREVLVYTILKLGCFLNPDYVIRQQENSLQSLRIWVHRATSTPITLLGWFGIMIAIRRDRAVGSFLLLVAGAFVAMHVIAIFGSRHKIPLEAVFCATSVLTLVATLEWWQRIRHLRVQQVRDKEGIARRNSE
jgi:4-amino-4-deoxy-L-arabinose transferase-like glycosyltransferase